MNSKDVCRTCLHSGGALWPLFNSNSVLPLDSPVFTFIEILQFFTDISISYHDGCPVQLCTDCRDDIHRIYTFILKCRRADSILKQLKDVQIRLTKLRDDSNQNNNDNDATEHYYSNIVRLQNENSMLKEIKEEPLSVPKDLDTVTDRGDSLLRSLKDRGDTMINTHENFVDGELVKVKEEPELDIKDENIDQAYLEYQSCTDIGNDVTNRDIDLNMIESLFQSHVTGNQMEEQIVWSINSNDFERSTQKSLTLSSDSSEIETNYRRPCAYTCSECLVTFRSELRFAKHMKIHNKSIQFECKICSKQHQNKYALESHMQRVHGPTRAKNKKHSCDICGKLYTRKAHLDRHLEGHANDKTFKCEFCTLYFRFKTTLAFHKRTKHLHEMLSSKNNCDWVQNDCETMGEQFTCELCLKIFPTKIRRTQHMKTHTVSRPFRCEICDKNFRTKHHLKCHDIRKHPLESPITGLQCDVCSRFFACKSDFTRHLQTHTGEKPFKCQICNDEYRYKRYFVNHMQEKHGVIQSNISFTA